MLLTIAALQRPHIEKAKDLRLIKISSDGK